MSHLSGLTPAESLRIRYDADRAVMAEVMPLMRHLVWAGGNYGAVALGVVDVDVGAGSFERVQIEEWAGWGSSHGPMRGEQSSARRLAEPFERVQMGAGADAGLSDFWVVAQISRPYLNAFK